MDFKYPLSKDLPFLSGQGEDQTRCRILVAEDDEDVRRFHAYVLTQSGYLVDTAEDGEIAWRSLQTRHYDLLITDNNMPKVSGLELLKKLRAARLPLPVIMATGILPAEEFAKDSSLAPDATLLKPYNSETLLESVTAVLHRFRQKRSRKGAEARRRSGPSQFGLEA